MASPNRASHDTLQGRARPDASIIRNALSMEAEHRGADPQKEKEKKKEDRALDEALEESFPASDPPAPSQPTGPGHAGDPRTKP